MASFPTAIATNAQLLQALDNAQTTLAAGINSGATSLSVVSAAAIASNTVVTIDSEQILLGTVVGTAATGCTRGYAGTTPASHSSGAAVYARVIAAHHNLLRDELIAVQQQLGKGMRLVRKCVRTTAYDWSELPSASTTAGNAITLTMALFPDGIVSGSVNKHYLRITDAVGGDEDVLITGTVVGTSITFTPTISHAAGDWIISSASGGIQEAIYGSSGKNFFIPEGSYTIYGQKIFVPRKVTIEGDGRQTTTLTLNSATANGFYSDTWGFVVKHLKFQTAGTPSGGAAIALVGTTAKTGGDADVEVEGCDFVGIYNGIDADWPGGFVRVTNCMFRAVWNIGIHVKASSASAVQITNNYADGRNGVSTLAPSIIYIEGTVAGGIINANWMQASQVHIRIASTGGDPTNELVIVGNILDQDTATTTCVGVESDGTAGGSSNCVKITGNYMRTQNRGVLLQRADFVTVSDNHFWCLGTDSAVTVAGLVSSSHINILNNRIRMYGATANYAIQLSNPAITHCWVTGNTATSEGGFISGFVGIATAAVNIHIKNNSAYGFTNLITNVGSTGNSEIHCNGNDWVMAFSGVTEATTLTIPPTDDAHVISITDSASGITEMRGLTCPVGCRKTFITAAAMTWSTSSAAENKIGRGISAAGAGSVIEFIKFTDGMWYPVKN